MTEAALNITAHQAASSGGELPGDTLNSQPTPAEDQPQVSGEGVSDVQAPLQEEAPKPTREDMRLSSKFAALARREREIQKRESELKNQQGSDEWRLFQEAKRENNPLKYMQAFGWSFDDLARFQLNDGKMTPEQQIKALQERIDKDAEERRKRDEQEKNEYIENSIRDFKASIKGHIDNGGDTYELIRLNGAYDTVFEVVNQYYEANGVILDIDVAAKHVESELEAEAEKLLSSSKKLAPRLALKETVPPVNDAPKTDKASPTLKNNSVIASAPSPVTYLSDEESKARAAQLLQKRLNGEA